MIQLTKLLKSLPHTTTQLANKLNLQQFLYKKYKSIKDQITNKQIQYIIANDGILSGQLQPNPQAYLRQYYTILKQSKQAEALLLESQGCIVQCLEAVDQVLGKLGVNDGQQIQEISEQQEQSQNHTQVSNNSQNQQQKQKQTEQNAKIVVNQLPQNKSKSQCNSKSQTQSQNQNQIQIQVQAQVQIQKSDSQLNKCFISQKSSSRPSRRKRKSTKNEKTKSRSKNYRMNKLKSTKFLEQCQCQDIYQESS